MNVSTLSGRRKRDIYGNWTWDDDANFSPKPLEGENQIKLDWRDMIALSIATLETVLLPVVIFIAVLFVFAILFTHA
jgi:hypothetical protein